MAPHIQPSRAMAANTATVLRAQRRLTKAGVMSWDSVKWMTSSTAGAATMRCQSSKVMIPTKATSPITMGGPTKGTKEASPMTAPHTMALGKPSKASAIDATTATAE